MDNPSEQPKTKVSKKADRNVLSTDLNTDHKLQMIGLLRESGWLTDLPADFTDIVVESARWRPVEIGERLYTDRQPQIMALAEGVASLTVSGGYSGDTVVHILRPPFWFGSEDLMGNSPCHFKFVMRSPGWLLSVEGNRLAELLENPFAWRAVCHMAARFAEMISSVAGDLIISKSERRVIAILLRCGGHRGPSAGPPLHAVPLTQEELAKASGLSRNTVVALLQKLAAKGLVRLSRGNIEIKDAGALLNVLEVTKNRRPAPHTFASDLDGSR